MTTFEQPTTPRAPLNPASQPDISRIVLPLVLATVVLGFVVVTPIHLWDLGGGITGWVGAERAGVLPLLFIIGSVLSLAGVLVCRWARWWGLVLAALPFLLLALTGAFVWAWLLALIFVAVIAGVDSWRAAIGPWIVAVAVSLVYCLTGVRALILGDAVDIRIARDYLGDSGPVEWPLLVSYIGAHLLLTTAPVLLAVAAGLARDAMRQRRAAAASERRAFEVASVTSERARLARDLHDVVAHHLSLVAVRAESAPFAHPDLGAEAREILAAIAADARSALGELRQVLKVLRRSPGERPERAPQPGAGDIGALLEQATDSGQQVRVTGEGWADVPPTAGYVLYRAVQEALTNARRHAPLAPVDLSIADSGEALTLRASNPVPPGQTLGADGRGLIGMRERVASLGGTVQAEITDDVFTVVVVIPLGDAGDGAGSAVAPDVDGEPAGGEGGAVPGEGGAVPGEGGAVPECGDDGEAGDR